MTSRRRSPVPEELVGGIGVDVGGSGSRATAFEVGEAGLLRATGGRECEHQGRLSRGLLKLIVETREQEAGISGPVGIAAPGRKTGDGRGIEYARNLEACPHLLDELRDGAPADLDLPDTLASDAEAALVGETVIEGGLLRGESSALLVAPGSGIAEAWLWCGEVRPIEGVRAWDLPPIREDDGVTDLEREGALLGLFGRWSGDQPLEQAVAEGDAGAVAALERFASALARLVDERGAELSALAREGGRPPAVLVRTRRGDLLHQAAVRACVRPALQASVRRHGGRLVLPEAPASRYAACAGALALRTVGRRARS